MCEVVYIFLISTLLKSRYFQWNKIDWKGKNCVCFKVCFNGRNTENTDKMSALFKQVSVLLSFLSVIISLVYWLLLFPPQQKAQEPAPYSVWVVEHKGHHWSKHLLLICAFMRHVCFDWDAQHSKWISAYQHSVYLEFVVSFYFLC